MNTIYNLFMRAKRNSTSIICIAIIFLIIFLLGIFSGSITNINLHASTTEPVEAIIQLIALRI